MIIDNIRNKKWKLNNAGFQDDKTILNSSTPPDIFNSRENKILDHDKLALENDNIYVKDYNNTIEILNT